MDVGLVYGVVLSIVYNSESGLITKKCDYVKGYCYLKIEMTVPRN